MNNILDFTNKNNYVSLKNGCDLCELLEYKYVKNISFITIQKYFGKNFIKYENNIYHMDYFGSQFNNICNELESLNDFIKSIEYKEINIKKGIILYNLSRSAGHEMCFLLCGIYHLYKLNLLDEYTIIIPDSVLSLGTFIKSMLLLLLKEDKIIFVDDKTIVNIEESIVYTPPNYKIKEHNDMLIEKLNMYKNINIKYENVCMIKSVIDGENMQSTPNKAFDSCYLNLFKNNNFEIISPNNTDIITLFNLINNCNNIILSWGCNAWINSIFVNKNTNVLILCHIDYVPEYNPSYTYSKDILTLCTPICNKLIMEFDLPSKLNNDITIKLQDSLNNLII